MRERIPQPIFGLLERLHTAGFLAYPVGGCVRDLLLGSEPHDWDLATSALPEETERLFADCRVVETGLRHGTVTVLAGGFSAEITSFRAEEGYSDGRHPDAVRFGVSLREDLARRDFTIGAMALDIAHDTVIDPFGGQEDLNAGILRAVGEPERRFAEDALRILRGLRFSAVLGFTIEPKTAAAMRQCAPQLCHISPERIRAELTKMLCGKNIAPVLREYPDILQVVLPEIRPMPGFLQHNPHHDRDVWEHTIAVVAAIPPEPVLRWAALLHDSAKPQCYTRDENGIGHFHGHQEKSAETAEVILRRLHCENRLIAEVTELIRIHDTRFPASERMAVRWAGRWGEERFRQFLELRCADTLAQAQPEGAAEYRAAMLRLLEKAKAEQCCFSVRQLALGGEELAQLGLRGREIGEQLEILLEAVQAGMLPNEHTALLAAAKSQKDEN